MQRKYLLDNIIFLHIGILLKVKSNFALANSKIKVLESTLEEDVLFPVIGATLKNPVKRNVTSLTICARFNYKVLGNSGSKTGRLITISDWQYDDNEPDFQFFWLSIVTPLSFFIFGNPMSTSSFGSWLIRDVVKDSFLVWVPHKWSHVCFSYDKDKSSFLMIIDGRKTSIAGYEPHIKNVLIPEDFLMHNRTSLGRCNWAHRYPCSDHYGKITDFNIWDKAMTEDEMIKWTTCNSMSKGNLINWDDSQWYLYNMTMKDHAISEICKPVKPGTIIMPEKRNFTESVGMCKKFKGYQTVIKNQQIQDNLVAEFDKYDQCKNDPTSLGTYDHFWGGWYDENEEGSYEDVNTGELLKNSEFQPWFPGEPNGDLEENCQSVWTDRNKWADQSCSKKACTFCFLEQAPTFQLKGLCASTLFDRFYSWTGNTKNGHYKFSGFSKSFIYWDSNNKEWRLEMYKDQLPYATCNTTNDYPIGKHSWVIFYDDCHEKNATLTVINMNACDEEEYSCKDGSCIPIENRCDGRIDCTDKSDEIDCKMIQIDESYLKEVPAPSREHNQELTSVYIKIDVLEVLEISEVDSFINFQIRLYLTWFDPRLTFRNLKMNENLNTLTSNDINKIWVPSIILYNTEKKLSSLNDDDAFAVIKRLGNSSISSMTDIENSLVFKGKDNPLTISRVYSTKFICTFDMTDYPFDSQICLIQLTMKGNSGHFVNIIAESLDYMGPTELTQYHIKDTQFVSNVSIQNDVMGIHVRILLGRRLLSHFLTTYLPTTLICIICFSTTYFRPFYFEAIVTVNLTALLVLTTMYISVSDGLPKTSYIKMIDIWVIMNLFVPFSEVLLQTLMDSLREQKQRLINHNGAKMLVDSTSKEAHPKVTKVKSKSEEIKELEMKSTTKFEIGIENKTVEMSELQTMMAFYTNERRLQLIFFAASKGLPSIFFVFAVIYFSVGLSYYGRDFSDFD